MTLPTYTPYDGSAKPFTIGLMPLDLTRWIEPDADCRRLPTSGDILFTIRVYVDPIAAIATHPRAARLAASFAAQLESLDEHQAAYKGLTLQKAALAAKLHALASQLPFT